MVFLNQEEQKKPEEQPPVVDVPQLKGFQTVVAPTDIPTNIPPINLQEHFDPKDYTGTGVEGGIGTGIVPSSDQVFMESVVEERPEVLSGPALNYPDLLRQAGVQGRVLVCGRHVRHVGLVVGGQHLQAALPHEIAEGDAQVRA